MYNVSRPTCFSLCPGVQQSSGGADVFLQKRQTPLQETRSPTEDLNNGVSVLFKDAHSVTLATLKLSKGKAS